MSRSTTIPGSPRGRTTVPVRAAWAGGMLTLLSATLPAAVIEVSSFYGTADGKERITAIGSDAAGNLYFAGVRTGPYNGPYTPYGGITDDVVVAKVSANGQNLVYEKRIGGSNGDQLAGMVVHPDGAVTLAGTTFSPDFPQTGTAQAFRGVGSGASAPYVISEGFVTRLAADGTVVYSRLISGSNNEAVRSIDAYGTDTVMIATISGSADLPVTTGMRAKEGTAAEGHLVLLDATGTVTRGSYLRTTEQVSASFKALADDAGHVYVAGLTTLSAVKSPVGFQAGIANSDDVFKLSADWQTVIYHSGVGGVEAMAVDRTRGALFTFSNGTNDTHPWSSSPSQNGAFQRSFPGGGTSITITKIKADGTSREYATWYGGSDHTDYFPDGAVVDAQGRLAFVMGALASNLPTVNGLSAPHRDSTVAPKQYGSAYYAIMALDGLSVDQASYIESDSSNGGAIGLTADGKLLVAGTTDGTSSLTLVNPLQTTPAGAGDAFYMRLNLTTVLPTVSAAFTTGSTSEGSTAILRLTRTGSTAEALTVHIAYNGDGSASLDMVPPPTSATIPVGASTLDIPIALLDDGVKESNESFNATLIRGGLTYAIAAPASGNSRAAMAAMTITDVNSSGKIGISMESTSTVSTVEGTTGTIKFERSGSLTSPLTITVAVSGSATNGADADFTAATTVNFGPGGAFGFLYVYTYNDDAIEGDETVTVSIPTNPTVTLVGPEPVLTIIDNDYAPTLPSIAIASTDTIADVRTGDPATFTISRTGSTSSSLSVLISVSGTATMGVDYQPIAVPVVIPSGAASVTVTITPINDDPAEGEESLTITLEENVAAYNLPGLVVFGQPAPPTIGPRSIALTLLDDAFVGTPEPLPADPKIAVFRGASAIADGATDDINAATVVTYTVENQGGTTLSLSGIPASIVGTNCTGSVVPGGGLSIAAGTSASLMVTMTPGGTGTWSLPLSFVTNDPTVGSYDWTITNTDVPVTYPGDLNGDGVVNVADLTLVTTNFGRTPSSPGYQAQADGNGDGTVTMADLTLVMENFSKVYP